MRFSISGLVIVAHQAVLIGVHGQHGEAVNGLPAGFLHCSHNPAIPIGSPSARAMRVAIALPVRQSGS